MYQKSRTCWFNQHTNGSNHEPHIDFLKRKQEVQTKKILKRTSGITCQYFRNINHINKSITGDWWVLNNKQLLIQGTSLLCGWGDLCKCKMVDVQVLAKSIKWQLEEINKHRRNLCTNSNQQYLLHIKNLLAKISAQGAVLWFHPRLPPSVLGRHKWYNKSPLILWILHNRKMI
jgi:hypothetical protein